MMIEKWTPLGPRHLIFAPTAPPAAALGHINKRRVEQTR